MSEPFTMWGLICPFDKHGVPVMGNSGRSIESVVVMRKDEFLRMIREHPSLATKGARP